MQYTLTQGTQGICPSGWHLPTDAEWTTLTTYLGGSSVAGGPLKEAGYAHWNPPNTGATNSSGFTALGAGFRTTSGIFTYLRDDAFFWSSTEYSSTSGWARGLSHISVIVDVYGSDKIFGNSVRCLKN